MNMRTSMALVTETRPKLDAFSVLTLLCGATSGITLNIIGELFLVELLLVPLAIVYAVAMRDGGKVFSIPFFWSYVIAGMVTLAGYVISDLVIGTSSSQYLRGWGRVLLLVSNCAALMLLTARNLGNLWWFLLGNGAGTLIYLAATGVSLTIWKLGYGAPIGLMILAFIFILPQRLGVVAIAALGLLNILLDSRVQSGVIFVVAAVIWARVGLPRSITETVSYVRLAIFGGVMLVLLMIGIVVTQEEFADRRETSNIGRSAGITVSLKAIAESPIIGYGSWTENEQYAQELREEVAESTDPEKRRRMGHGKLFRSHSQILQSWIEGGFFGAAFFLFYGYTLIITLHWHVLKRPLDYLSPLFLYTLLNSFWHLLASPFGGETRVQIATATAVVIAMVVQRGNDIQAGSESQRSEQQDGQPSDSGRILQRRRRREPFS